MTKGFWKDLKRPIFVLAPMADVTDSAFRQIIAKYGKPDVMYTEFVSTDGLCSPGKQRLLVDLQFQEIERPIVAQIFGSNPDNFYQTALLLQELKFDGIDINMGCPDRGVEKGGAGAALINSPKLAQQIIRATQKGAGNLPVSVKTRLGYNTNIVQEWIPQLLETQPVKITIHCRTRKEMSLVPANWDSIAKAVDLAKGTETMIFGNGDVTDLEDAAQKVKDYGVDGVMLGRAIFGNPWLFNQTISSEELSLQQRLQVMVEHAQLYEAMYNGIKNFAIMRKHFGSYVGSFPHAKDLKVLLMQAQNAQEVESVVNSFLLKT